MSPILMLEYPARAWQSVLYSAMEMVPSPDRSNLANTSDRAAPGDCRSDECEVCSEYCTSVLLLDLLDLPHGVVASSPCHVQSLTGPSLLAGMSLYQYNGDLLCRNNLIEHTTYTLRF